MTDFFADLEREIRAAHPRRSRPVVPVRGIAATAAVAATLVAAVLAIGALSPPAEREVAGPGVDEGWTAYAPLNCADREVADGRIPDEIVDRFAILRGDADPAALPDDQIPSVAISVIRQSLREVGGPDGRRYVFALVRLARDTCEEGPLGVCLVGLDSETEGCLETADGPFEMTLMDDLDDGRKVVIVVGDDEVRRVRVDIQPPPDVAEIDLEANVGFEIVPGGTTDIGVEPIGP